MRDWDSDDACRCAMITKMNAKFDKYCHMESLNGILIMEIVLDPRYKLDYMEYWYNDFLSYDPMLSDETKKKLQVLWIM